MRSLAIATLLVAASASAQVAPPSVGPDNGFFRPTPGNDPSLTRPPAAVTAPPSPAPAPLVVPVEVPVPYVTMESARVTEEQLDRAKREAEEAQARAARAPAPITGAFTGSTSERDR